MTINELIENLECIRDRYDGGEFKIVGALQPNYPLKGDLLNICTDQSKEEVYLAMSDGLSYGVPKGVWDDDIIYDED